MLISKEKFIDTIAMYCDDIRDMETLYDTIGFDIWESESFNTYRCFTDIIANFICNDDDKMPDLLELLDTWVYGVFDEDNVVTIGELYDKIVELLGSEE